MDRNASTEKGATLLLLSGGTGPDVMAHDVTDPADVQTLGTLSGHKLAVQLPHSWIRLLFVKQIVINVAQGGVQHTKRQPPHGRDGTRRDRFRGRADARDPQWTQTRGKQWDTTTQLDHTTRCKDIVSSILLQAVYNTR